MADLCILFIEFFGYKHVERSETGDTRIDIEKGKHHCIVDNRHEAQYVKYSGTILLFVLVVDPFVRIGKVESYGL